MERGYIRDYQTPPDVCRYMASLVPAGSSSVLEPTKGKGNLVAALADLCYEVIAPDDYFLLDKKLRFNAVVMNPPFSSKSTNMENAPAGYPRGMNVGYQMLFECMQKSSHIIALMPWYTISDSDVRLRYLKKFGLVSVTLLPRRTFEYARIQTCVLQLDRHYAGQTEFRVYDLLRKVLSKGINQLFI